MDNRGETGPEEMYMANATLKQKRREIEGKEKS